jgi:hypothetical protein
VKGPTSKRHIAQPGDATAAAELVCGSATVDEWCQRVGRTAPNGPTVTAVLIAHMLLAQFRSFHFVQEIPEVIGTVSDSERQRLGLEQPNGQPFSERQWNRTWQKMIRVVEPFEDGLDEDEKKARIQFLNRLAADLFNRSARGHMLRGSIAIDTTLTKSWQAREWRPQDKFAPRVKERHSSRKVRSDAGRRDPTVNYVHNDTDPEKCVHGYGIHAVVAVPELDRAGGAPLLYTAMHLTGAANNAAEAGMFTLDNYTALRRTLPEVLDGTVPALRDVLADGGFGQHRPADWHHLIRALGGTPVFPLHSHNQEGRAVLHGDVMVIDGRPYCRCLPEPLITMHYPRYANNATKAEYAVSLRAREPYEFRTHGPFDAAGSRRFRRPHDNCGHCAHLPPERRCCKTPHVTLDKDALGIWQPHIHGSADWKLSINRRTLVEISFAHLKSRSTTNLSPGSVRLIGYAKVFVAFLMRMLEHNRLALIRWAIRAEKLEKAGITPDRLLSTRERRAAAVALAAQIDELAKKRGVNPDRPDGDPPILD